MDGGSPVKRRNFLAQSLAAAAVGLAARTSKSMDSHVEVLIEEPIGRIERNLHGHFIEHIGGVIYDGIWVGEDSKVPNVGGIRKKLIESLLKLNVPIVRWPGGCFADSYDWRDGIGPPGKRPCRTNFWINDPFLEKAPDGPQKYEPNQFGTDEFMHFCRLIGAEPYIAANVRSLTALDFDRWVEYCNAPPGSTTLAKLRADNGNPRPYAVRYWGIGNESWGCGGNFTAEEYSTEFRRFASWVPDYGVQLRFVGSGPNSDDFNWTRSFFTALAAKGKSELDNLYAWALHYYCGTAGKGQAIDFQVGDWYELLGKADLMESLIEKHWSVMGEVDKEHQVKLVVDEWGAWHKAGTEIDRSFLFGQTSTMRDALVAALTLDTFHRHSDKLAMANVAQLINNLHSLFLAHEDRFVVTPNFHVFEAYKAHQGGQSVRLVAAAPRIFRQQGKPGASLWGLAGSASLHDKKLVLTLVNPHVEETRPTEIMVRGASIRSCKVRTLSAPDIHAFNSFDHPHAVEPKDEIASVRQSLAWNLQPASVTRLEMDLA
jgi:alpha-N-arabinofuranosidase